MDLQHTSWRFDEWLATYSLNDATVLDYFAHSPWWDPSCTNAQVAQQGLTAEEGRLLVGTEFIVTHSTTEGGGLFVIERRERRGRDDVSPVAIYYILVGTLYEAPSLYGVLTSRIEAAAWRLERAIVVARDLRKEQFANAASVASREVALVSYTADETSSLTAGARLIDEILLGARIS